MMDVGTASLLESSGTMDIDNLNTSDHLPQSLVFILESWSRIDWSRVRSSNALNAYQSGINAIVTPLLGGSYANIDNLNKEV